MQYRQLGSTDLNVSSLGMGCVTFGREIDCTAAFEILDHAWEKGITLLDTAEAYAKGGSETVVGDWMADRGVRDRVVLATKASAPLSGKHILEAAEASLKRLKTDHIDLYQVHVWDAETPVEETLEALTTLVKQGKVRHIGCSNWQAWQMAKSLLLSERHAFARIQSVQPPYNLVQREIEADLLPLCADQQIGVLSYSPLGAGFLTGKYRRDQEVPAGTRFDVIPGHQPIYFTDRGFAVVEELEQISQETSRSMVQLGLAWVLSRPHVTSMLIGARKISHIDQAIEADASGLSVELAERLEDM